MNPIAPSWTDHLRPDDLLVVAQGIGEPTPLLEQALDAAPAGTEIFVGLSHSRALVDGAHRPLLSFGAMGPLAARARDGSVEIIPAHFDDLPRVLPHRGRDIVVLMQVSPANDRGEHNLGLAVDYTYELAPRARMVVAEVNAELPPTSAPGLAAAGIDIAVPTSRPVPVLDTPDVEDAHRRIARRVAALIPHGATLQLGVGSVAGALGHALGDHRRLAVRSTLAGDWLLSLADSGAMSTAPDAVVISEAAGSSDLYKYVATSEVCVRPVAEVVAPPAAGELTHFVAVNSALQVDLTGQVNAERIATGPVGGIGGQAEYLRAAQRCAGGLSVVALPASAGRHSRIVAHLTGTTVSTARSYVDLIVTEHGVADLRGRSLRERAQLLIGIADPAHRAELERGIQP